jgi:hypothetical protein
MNNFKNRLYCTINKMIMIYHQCLQKMKIQIKYLQDLQTG